MTRPEQKATELDDVELFLDLLPEGGEPPHVEQCERPDFVLVTHTGRSIALEVTRCSESSLQAMRAQTRALAGELSSALKGQHLGTVVRVSFDGTDPSSRNALAGRGLSAS